jgi:N-acetylglutamate synthase-like GNAT family acetyltransferase
MRVRNFRQEDIPALFHIHQLAAQTDGTPAKNMAEFEAWLAAPGLDAASNVFVVMDDEESNEWGQGGTLEGVEGEVIGYTVLQLHQSHDAYHLRCEGAVHPEHRRRHAGLALLICALNRARIWAFEFEFEAQQEGRPIYFEALLPQSDPASENLAAQCEMQPVNEEVVQCMRLYRSEL